MTQADFFSWPPYSLPQPEKEAFLLNELNSLTSYHAEQCSEYRRLLNLFYQSKTHFDALEDLPYLPVNLFKFARLNSVPPKEIFKILQSSGTTGSKPSQIVLDRETAQKQRRALSIIIQDFIGPQRLPLLIIDTADLVQQSEQFNARQAGIIGMLNFGRDPFYALDQNMQLKKEALHEWLAKHRGETFLVFGFTFMVWRYFIQALQPSEIDLSSAILFHSGGWKKLEEEWVNNRTFKSYLQQITHLNRCHNFYGMVEQVGSIFVECEQGVLHCPSFADILIRDPVHWKKVSCGQEGVIQVISMLPKSYPGHSLLTEDLGILLGTDDCPCGRKGNYFQMIGRVAKTELRGCSDTFAYR